ncbi:NepR family anti-sigma factor [Frigidibacter sp. SD6-1]|nr:NepR family anti-sigma factor [Frigidibacter sp. SD6-1]
MAEKRDAEGLKARIDENLKRVYQEVLEEEVPDRFKQLLDRLRQKGSAK